MRLRIGLELAAEAGVPRPCAIDAPPIPVIFATGYPSSSQLDLVLQIEDFAPGGPHAPIGTDRKLPDAWAGAGQVYQVAARVGHGPHLGQHGVGSADSTVIVLIKPKQTGRWRCPWSVDWKVCDGAVHGGPRCGYCCEPRAASEISNF